MDKTKDDGSPKAKEKAMAGVLSQPARWRLLQLLAKDDGMPVRELARRIGKKPRLTGRDISLMRKAGLVEEKYPRIYRLAAPYRPLPGATHVDFGTWSLRLED